MSAPKSNEARKIVATNRRARHDFEIFETYEAGMVLLGSEVKSLRVSNVQLKDSFGVIRDGEAFLIGMHIAPYAFSGNGGHMPERQRKLLLHQREITKIATAVHERGLTIVPMSLYFSGGRAKLEIGVGRGKRQYDKRQSLKAKDQAKEMRYRGRD